MHSIISPENGVLAGVLVLVGWLLRQFIKNHTTRLDDAVTKLGDVVTTPVCEKQHTIVKEALEKGEKKFDGIAKELVTQGKDITELKTTVDLLPALIVAEIKENGGKVKFD